MKKIRIACSWVVAVVLAATVANVGAQALYGSLVGNVVDVLKPGNVTTMS